MLKRISMLLIAAIVLGWFAFSFAQTEVELPDSVREYLAEKLFDGIDPADPSIDTAVEILTIPESMRAEISKLEWEAGQLENFATNKLYMLVTTPAGEVHALMFRDGKKRKDKVLTESRVRVLRRLYSAELFNMPPDEVLQDWLDKEEVDAGALFEMAVLAAQTTSSTFDTELDIDRARENYLAEDTNTKALGRALGALSEGEYSADSLQAALWLISRMDKMSFRRENKEDSIGDLTTVDAQLFYENVYYAVKAANEFPWCKTVSPEDFCQQVLSPRGTGEPLQRWRRHFYLALEPEVRDLTADQVDIAIDAANNAYSDFYQYEGATTWEDFGMLTALAVHEGRCEDCSNVQNAMLRTTGIPGCQAYTPWWGHQDGNHAWTWLRGVGEAPRDGRNAVKVYMKTWDGNVDVTADYNPVTTIEVATDAVSEDPAELMVWNHEEWRKITTEPITDGAVVFNDIGCRRDQFLLVRITGESDKVADLREDGTYTWLDLSAEESDASELIQVDYDKTTPLGEMSPDEDYELVYFTSEGWLTAPSERLSTGGFTFEAATDRLYRITGPGVANRPFTIELDEDSGEVVTLRR